jgi:hypothetical protein
MAGQATDEAPNYESGYGKVLARAIHIFSKILRATSKF